MASIIESNVTSLHQQIRDSQSAQSAPASKGSVIPSQHSDCPVSLCRYRVSGCSIPAAALGLLLPAEGGSLALPQSC